MPLIQVGSILVLFYYMDIGGVEPIMVLNNEFSMDFVFCVAANAFFPQHWDGTQGFIYARQVFCH